MIPARPAGLDRGHLIPFIDRLRRLPFWLLAALLLGLIFTWYIFSHDNYRNILSVTASGMLTTLVVSLVAFVFSILAGLVLGLMRVSPRRLLRETATFYVEIVRGVPMLVILYYIAFVGAPGLIEFLNWLLSPMINARWFAALSIRNLDFTGRAILALCIGYSAFISEIFRAGIESIPRGQFEAALALGMSRGQALRRVVLPQAIRNVLPPLGNEFVAMIKDSALVSALGVQDITQLGKVYSASNFTFFETYNVVAFLYLVMTISLSLLVRVLETRLSKHKRAQPTLH